MRWFYRTAVSHRTLLIALIALLTLAMSGVLQDLARAGAPATSAGTTLIGKLEGPEVITDPAQFPKAFKEAPQLAELV
jgi:hypothetical protein